MRVKVSGRVQGVFFRQTTQERARELGVLGWVRNEDDGSVLVHAEGPREAIERLAEFLQTGPPNARVEAAEVEAVKVEGHEQFAIRGVSAGQFAVLAHGVEGSEAGEPGRYELRLEVEGEIRSWSLQKQPSMDPAVKRLAIEQAPTPGTAPTAPAATEPGTDPTAQTDPAATTWDRGPYEQGGRVPWPEAIERGHAVFVLNGDRLRGGFALQRTGKAGDPRWLLIKRRDAEAQRA